MSYKLKQLIYSEIRKLKNKVSQRQREIDKLNDEIKELEEKYKKE